LPIRSTRPPPSFAIHTNYRAIVDVSAGGGYGTLYGPNVLADGTMTMGEGKIAGTECLAYADDGSGRQNATLMVQIPERFDPSAPCIVTGPSSGSRGIYGAIGTSGEWGLKNGCAVAYTDKGTGTGAHDLKNDSVNLIDGVRESADFAERRANFRARISDTERTAFNADTPDRFAFKHAHSEQNPEADWDVNVLQATLFAFLELNRRYPKLIYPANTIVIGSSVSNGGAASLRAAEVDPFGLIDGVAVSEPNVNPPPGAPFSIAQGDRPLSTQAGKSLYDYVTHINIFQGCANLSPPDAPLNSLPAALAENRCTALHAHGLVTSGTIAEQAREAQAIINRYGILREQNVVQPALWTLFVPQAIAVTYGNAYVSARVQDNLCDYSFGAADVAGNPIVISGNAEAILFGISSGIPPTGGVNVINNASLGGPRQNTLSVSPAGVPEQNLGGALCLRALWTGSDPVTGDPPSGASLEAHRRLHHGIADILATADLNGTPAIIVQGRADGVIHPNHAGRAYYARNRQIKAEQSRLRYIEVTMYRARFFGHKAALCGLVRGDGCGHPVPPCFGGASVAVLFQEPVLVVAIEVRPDGGADLLDVLEDTSENDLLLQRADEALGDAVGFRLTDESEAGRHAEEPQLVLEVLGHEGAAVIVTQQHLARGIRADGSEHLADGQRQRLSGGVTVSMFGDVPAEALGVPVLGDDEQRDVAVVHRRDDGAVGAPHDVRRIGGDRAAVVVRRTGRAPMRGEQAVLAHDPQHAGPADPDAVDHPQPGPHLAVALAGPRRARQVPANGGEQVGVAERRFRAASTGRSLGRPSLLAPGVVKRGSRHAPDRAHTAHPVNVPGRRRGRGGHQRDLLRAKGPGFSSRARNSSFSMLNSPMRRCASASSRSFGSSSRSRSPASIPASPRCRHSSNFHTGTASRRDKSSTGSPCISRSTTSRLRERLHR
jgi:hydroxybutyrate-dimer hydrolase